MAESTFRLAGVSSTIRMSALAERVMFRAHFLYQQLKLIESIGFHQVVQPVGQRWVARANALDRCAGHRSIALVGGLAQLGQPLSRKRRQLGRPQLSRALG